MRRGKRWCSGPGSTSDLYTSRFTAGRPRERGMSTQQDSGRTQSEKRSVGSLASPEPFIHAELAAAQLLSRSKQQLTSCK